MCSTCGNFDLCEKCEAQGIHSEHQFLKVRNPKQAPAKIVCQYSQKSGNGGISEDQAMEQAIRESMKNKPNKPEKKRPVRYSGRFVKESFTDKQEFAPGQKFKKQWTFRNDGETAWDAETQFIQTNGDELGAVVPVNLDSFVPANSEYVWEVEFTAPTEPGRYTAYFRMSLTPNIRFGHKVWCDIMVVEPEVEEQKQVQNLVSSLRIS